MTYLKFLTCYLLSTMMILHAARILAVFPVPSISHQIVFRPLTQELARHGHDVVVITTDPAFPPRQTPPNFTEIDVHDISYSLWRKSLKKIAEAGETDITGQINMVRDIYLAITVQQLRSENILSLISNKSLQFDLVLVEACMRPALIYSYIFKAPIVQLSSLGPITNTNLLVGAPSHPILHPLAYRRRTYNLTLLETIYEFYLQSKWQYFDNNNHEYKETIALRKLFGSQVKTVPALLNSVDLIFINNYPIWNDNAPVPPSLVYMGGVHVQHAKELPEDLISYMDSSKNGIIYVSFGTNVPSSALSPKVMKSMVKVFSELPYDVMWKWDTDLSDKHRNIKVFKWLPQSDVLRHPKLKLFITQGGLQSTDEAIVGGVPLLGIPVITDQWRNTEKYVRLGIGKQLKLRAFTEDMFKNYIHTIINNESYRNNIRRLRAQMQDQPQSPLERTVRWVEHVLRHGDARHLRCPAANMSWTEYYELELILLTSTTFFTIIASLMVTIYYLRNILLSKLINVNTVFT